MMKTIPKLLAILVLCGIVLAAAKWAASPATAAPAGGSGSNLKVKAVWLYPFEAQERGLFQGVTVIEKSATTIKFKAGDNVYEHCGHYTIEN